MNEITTDTAGMFGGADYRPEQRVASVGMVPWQHLIVPATKRAYGDGTELMADLGLDWDVEKRRFADPVTGDPTPFYGVFRTDTNAALGAVRQRWTAIQNREAIGDVLVDLAKVETDLRIVGGGVLGQGERVWVMGDLGDAAIEGRPDAAVNRYLLFLLQHGGGSALIATVPNQVMCANALAGLVKQARSSEARHSISHTKNYAQRLAAARFQLREARNHFDRLMGTLGELNAQPFDRRQMHEFAEKLISETRESIDGTKEISDRAKARREETVTTVNRLFTEGVGCEGRTKLDALNAVTEYLSHHRRRAKKAGDETKAALSRLEDEWFGGNTRSTRQRALRLLRGGGVE